MKVNAKECSNYCTIALISHASKVMLKIFQARVQQYLSHEIPDVLEKAEEPEIKLPTFWIIGKTKKFQKNVYLCFITYAKAFDCVDHHKLENSARDGNIRPPDLLLEKSVCKLGSSN